MLLIYKVPTQRFVEEHHLGLSHTLILVVLSALRAHSGGESLEPLEHTALVSTCGCVASQLKMDVVLPWHSSHFPVSERKVPSVLTSLQLQDIILCSICLGEQMEKATDLCLQCRIPHVQ